MQRRRRRYARWETPDLWAGLGPGDPGYRLRPGASGLDPFETWAESGRVLGTLLKSALTGRLGRFPIMSIVVLGGLLQILLPHVVAGWDTTLGVSIFWNGMLLATWLTLLGLLLAFLTRVRRPPDET